jgi:hypothetical protein
MSDIQDKVRKLNETGTLLIRSVETMLPEVNIIHKVGLYIV